MSEIKDRQDAASAIHPIVAAQADDNWAAAAVEGFDEPAAALDAESMPAAETDALRTPEAEPHQPADGDEGATETVEAADIADDIEAALLSEAPHDATSFETMPAAYADTIVDLDPAADASDDEAPLLDGDLEDGIASVFAALHAARDDAAPAEPSGDLEAADVVTFRLLGELDRLWHRAA
jgi:hypothetical protein